MHKIKYMQYNLNLFSSNFCQFYFIVLFIYFSILFLYCLFKIYVTQLSGSPLMAHDVDLCLKGEDRLTNQPFHFSHERNLWSQGHLISVLIRTPGSCSACCLIRNGYSRYPYPYRVLLARTSVLAHVFANFNSNKLHFVLLVTVYTCTWVLGKANVS